jgi:hypothetical protein
LDENARLGGDGSRLLSAILVIFKVEPEFPVGMGDDCVRRRYMPYLWSQPLGISAFGMGLIRWWLTMMLLMMMMMMMPMIHENGKCHPIRGRRGPDVVTRGVGKGEGICLNG